MINRISRQYQYCYRHQQGTVLIIALIIIALITGIAARFTSDFQLTIARAEQGVVSRQLQQFLYSVENFAGWVLIEDANTDKDDENAGLGEYDHLGENWVRQLQAPIEEATVDGKLEDALSRFNLNSLQKKLTAPTFNPDGLFTQRYTPAQRRFIRLLQTHPDDIIDTSLAKEITEAVMDWLDEDSNVSGSGGAENDYYESLEKPYRSANQFFANKTELRLVKGMTKEIYDYLSPLVVALPEADSVFNLNTASIELIRTINSEIEELPLDEDQAKQLIASRPINEQASIGSEDVSEVLNNNTAEAFENFDAFLNSDDYVSVFTSAADLRPSSVGIETGSEYFLLQAEVRLLEFTRSQVSLIKREPVSSGFTTKVVRRTRELF